MSKRRFLSPCPQLLGHWRPSSHRWRITMDEAARDLFLRRKEAQIAESRQRAALQLLAGIDLDEMFGMPAGARDRMLARLRRALERERLRGLRRHWSYDLNRHIALKQALDRLAGNDPPAPARKTANPRPKRQRTRAATAGAGGCACRRDGRRCVAPESAGAASGPCACGRDPSSSRAGNGPGRSSGRPSDSWRRGPISRGTDRETIRSGSSGAA